MKKYSVLAILVSLIVLLPACEIIGDIFAAGMWVGILLVFLIALGLYYLLRGRRKP